MLNLKKFIMVCFCLFITVSLSSAIGSDSKKSDSADNATERYNSGVTHMEKARQILIVGDSAFAYNYRATSNAKAQREYEKAVKDFKEAITVNPSMKEAYNNIGFCFRKLDKLDESLKYYKQALKLDPDFAQALEYMGETYLALDDLESAKKNLNRLTELKSPYADTLSHSIEIYKLNRINESLKNGKK